MRRAFLLLVMLTFYAGKVNCQSVVIMEKENGVYYIPCLVNNVPMKFIFDTGASNVSISLTEALFLVKQGLLERDAIGETVNYQIADGQVKEGTEIILKEIIIGDYILRNVRANVVHNLEAPLLLGQNALSELGKFEIDGNRLKFDSKGELTRNDLKPVNSEGENEEPKSEAIVYEIDGALFSHKQLQKKYGDRVEEAINRFGFRRLSKKELGKILSLKFSRKSLVEAYNNLRTDKLNNEDIKTFARTVDNNLQIFHEWTLPIEDKVIIEVIIEMSKSLPFTKTSFLMEISEYRELLKFCDYEFIEFKTVLNFPSSTKKLQQTIRWDDLDRLPIPFTEEEFYSILR